MPTTNRKSEPLEMNPFDAFARPADECLHCGETRSRAVYYKSSCYREGEWACGVYIPGPSRGAHEFPSIEREPELNPNNIDRYEQGDAYAAEMRDAGRSHVLPESWS